MPVAVIEGDQETSNDARAHSRDRCCRRFRSTPAAAAISTRIWSAMPWTACRWRRGSMLFIENVGNLVCPAGFDLGETCEDRDPFGHRRRRQTAQISGCLCGRLADDTVEDRPPAACRFRRRALHWPCPGDQSWDRGTQGLGTERGRDGAMAYLARDCAGSRSGNVRPARCSAMHEMTIATSLIELVCDEAQSGRCSAGREDQPPDGRARRHRALARFLLSPGRARHALRGRDPRH